MRATRTFFLRALENVALLLAFVFTIPPVPSTDVSDYSAARALIVPVALFALSRWMAVRRTAESWLWALFQTAAFVLMAYLYGARVEFG